MTCGICGGSMDFDDEIWSWVCNDCGMEYEIAPGDKPVEVDLSEDEERQADYFDQAFKAMRGEDEAFGLTLITIRKG